jgi:hypothetical protein
MERQRGPLDQLDVPLVWDRAPSGAPTQPAPRRERPPAPPAPWSRARLWVATLADLGEVLLSVAAAWGIAGTLGAALTPPQLAVTAVAGMLAAAVLGVGSLWGYRASPGMALLRLRFAQPLTFSGSVRAWIGWLAALAVLGLPLSVGAKGRTIAERLGGSDLTLHSPPGAA